MKRAFILAFLSFLLCGCPKVSAQVPVSLGPSPKAQFLDNTGKPLSGGQVFTYNAGTSTPLATYQDSSGLIANPNPIILDAGGRANVWWQGLAYKVVVKNSGGVTQYTTDNFQASSMLSLNNSFTGNNSFSGTTLFSGAATFSSGGAMSGVFSGSPTLSGNPTFSGAPLFSGTPLFTNGITVDAITGTLTNGGTFQFLLATGAASTPGENFNLAAGQGGSGSGGGVATIAGGTGSSTGGAGGGVVLNGGSTTSGNSAGGNASLNGGSGTGTGTGGAIVSIAGAGGSTAGNGGLISLTAGTGGAGGNGGDLSLIPGAKGGGGQDGSIVIGKSGRIKFNVNITAVAPTCTSNGIGASGTCTLANYSTDTSGIINLNVVGAGPTATGSGVLTFNQTMGANGHFCIMVPVNTVSLWNARATAIWNGMITATTTAFAWDNNAVALTAANTYSIGYFCRGEN